MGPEGCHYAVADCSWLTRIISSSDLCKKCDTITVNVGLHLSKREYKVCEDVMCKTYKTFGALWSKTAVQMSVTILKEYFPKKIVADICNSWLTATAVKITID